jgi:hypothetical protein
MSWLAFCRATASASELRSNPTPLTARGKSALTADSSRQPEPVPKSSSLNFSCVCTTVSTAIRATKVCTSVSEEGRGILHIWK